jgi:hypothetical protein
MSVELTEADGRPFRPKKEQMLAKSKFWGRYEEQAALLDLQSLTKEDVRRMSGSRHIETWLRDPEFAAWFFEKDSLAFRLRALKEAAVDVLEEILLSEYEEKILTAKDKLKAADLILQVTGSFPSRTKEVVFYDERLNRLSPEELEKELAEAKQKVLLASSTRGVTDET